MNKDQAIAISFKHGVLQDGLSFPIGMAATAVEKDGVYVIVWKPDPGRAGFVYKVRVDKATGKVLSSKTAP